ncbi:MAG: heparinase II/III family protein [Verrucomicrobia bacterium]|nr:heparinase II/III family protein [Verrucomicrobiota bacterium]
MPSLEWYWHRLRAMSAGEVTLRIRKKFRELADATLEHDWAGSPLENSGTFPKLPEKSDAPEPLRSALRRDADDILAGRWRAFGHLELKVDDPPHWHCDYLAGKDFTTTASAFRLDHRALPGGADIKLIWELSRWHQLTRLAMAAHVLGDEKAGEKCVLWLEDWVKHNPPFRGWNWTSALEAGLRLINFAWMDALLAPHAERWGCDAELDRLRHELLPPHAWFTWRHKSFGSSANNHLIGELAGLIVATARWPALAQWAAPLDELQRRWEREVLAQFAEDGGNKEQALNYHLFSWELCWHARAALVAAGRAITPAVEERLRHAAQFYVDVQVPSDPWDFGDSDNAFAVPLFADEARAIQEWYAWLERPKRSEALEFWMDTVRRDFKLEIQDLNSVECGWRHYKKGGQQVWQSDDFTLRMDVSSLGYLATAAHGQLDALHLALWRKGVALVVDAGTGCYYADQSLRGWLASARAHNGPVSCRQGEIKRLGPFLWSKNHDGPFAHTHRSNRSRAEAESEMREKFIDDGCTPEQADRLVSLMWGNQPERWVWDLAVGVSPDSNPRTAVTRLVSIEREQGEISVLDNSELSFVVRWQFAPGAKLERLAERRFRVTRRGVAMEVEVSADWGEVWAVSDRNDPAFMQAEKTDEERKFAGVVSPAFRKTEWAPYLKLVARPGEKPCLFTTTFLASRDA